MKFVLKHFHNKRYYGLYYGNVLPQVGTRILLGTTEYLVMQTTILVSDILAREEEAVLFVKNMSKLELPYQNVMTKQEEKELNEAKERQQERLKTMRKVEDKEENKEMRYPIDMYGKTIFEGCYINYPVRRGSDTYMRTARVLKVRERNNHLDNPEVVLDVAVAIAPRAWERKNNPNWEDDIKIRKVTVSRPYRATVLPPVYVEKDKRYRILNTVLTH